MSLAYSLPSPACGCSLLAPVTKVINTDYWHCLPATRESLNLQICLEGGQAFNWVRIGTEHWSSVYASGVLTLTYDSCGSVIFSSSSSANIEDAYHFLVDYFRLNVSLEELMLKWRSSDPYFDSICDKFTGVRILRQDPFLALLSFICSANNNIARITKMVQSLHTRFGTPLKLDDDFSFLTHTFPSLDQLVQRADTLEDDLRTMGFGYRAKFITESVKLLSSLGLSSLHAQRNNQSYDSVISYLLQFPGVGRKVADCVALFSLDQLDAFPIDVHVYKLALKVYISPKLHTLKAGSRTLSPSNYLKIRSLFCNLFKMYPGWAQSILFTSELRQFSLKDKTRP